MTSLGEERPLRLLALDGGGIRGLSELIIVREIMYRLMVKENERLDGIPKPCDYFDLIGGTSTGGIIALMLGRLRMDVDRAILCYDQLVKDVFSKSKRPGGDGMFSATKLETALKSVVNEELGNPDSPLLDVGESQICRTFVCARNANSMRLPVLFRTYRSHQTPTDCTIWQAARATSAAPTFFKRIIIGGDQPYIDGGMGSNNPTSLLLDEANNLFPSRKIGCLVSVGAGRPFPPSIPKPGPFQRNLPTNVVNAIIEIATDCDNVHQSTYKRFAQSPRTYYRLNVDQGMQEVKLSEWEKMDKVRSHTSQYLSDALVQTTLTSLVDEIGSPKGHLTPGLLISPGPPHSTERKTRSRLRSAVPSFQGRRDILNKMHNYFRSDSQSRRVFVLHGLGGAGKTQIALKFLEEYQLYEQSTSFTDIFSIDATNEQTVKASLTTTIPEGIEKSVDASLEWLADRPNDKRNWLLFFDNADDVGLNLSQFFPQCRYGNILVTTRNRQLRVYAVGSDADVLVGGMSLDDAKDLLFERSGEEKTGENERIAQHIVEELGYIPLAISQAGGYIKSCSIALRHYQDLFQDQRDQLLQHRGIQENDPALYATWKLSYDQLEGPARAFLQVCSLLHREGISEEMFKRAALSGLVLEDVDLEDRVKYLLELLGKERSGWDSWVFQGIVKSLSSYSLLEFDKESNSYSIHPLVQHWGYHTLGSNKHKSQVETLGIISLAVGYKEDDWIYGPTLLQHVARTMGTTRLQEIDTVVAAIVASVYSANGYWVESEVFGMEVVKRRKESLGEDHPHTLSSIGGLASTYWNQGKWKEAEELGAVVVEKRKKKLGEYHPSTLLSMGNLALTYSAQGKWKDAEELEVQTVETSKRELGEDHSLTLTNIGNLALIYRNQGKWDEAEALELVVMEKGMKKLGENHPDMLKSMAFLALTYRNHGKWKEAEELEAVVIKKKEKVLGEDHPETLSSMASLASIYWNQGRWKEAEELGVAVVKKQRKKLGEDHPETLLSMGNLALTFADQGKWEEAEELGVEVVGKCKQKLGENHPDTFTAMGNLVLTYRDQGKLEEAEELGVMVVERCKKRLGEDHPTTLISMGNLASIYRSQGRWKEAEELDITVAEKMKKKHREDHPHNLVSMRNLALTFEGQGRWKEAEELEVAVMKRSKEILGDNHPNTLKSMENLAFTYRNQSKWKEAEKLDIVVMKKWEKKLGDDHSETLASMHNLVFTYWNQGKWKEAEELGVQVLEREKKKLGENHPRTLMSMADLAFTYWHQGRQEEAEELRSVVIGKWKEKLRENS